MNIKKLSKVQQKRNLMKETQLKKFIERFLRLKENLEK